MDDSSLSYLLSMEAIYAAEMSAHPITWTPDKQDLFSPPIISIPSSVAPVPSQRAGSSWMNSSVPDFSPFYDIPAHAAISTSAPSPLATCRLGGSTPCDRPLDGTLPSIRKHLSMHGHKHHGRATAQCPWAGCSERLQWMNVPRHIRSIHLGVRTKCPNCKKSFTRPLGLAKHVASEKCSATLLMS